MNKIYKLAKQEIIDCNEYSCSEKEIAQAYVNLIDALHKLIDEDTVGGETWQQIVRLVEEKEKDNA